MYSRFVFIAYLLGVIICCCCCNTAKSSQSGREHQESHQDSDLEVSTCAKGNPAYTEQYQSGFYYVPEDEKEFLFYYDNTTGASIKVCSKVNCTHDTDECDAFYGAGCSIDPYSLQMYQGRLYLWVYTISGGAHLLSILPDGSERKDLCIFKTADTNSVGIPRASVIINDKVYVIATVGVNQLGYEYERVYQIDLKKGSTAELLYQGENDEQIEHQVMNMVASDGKLYFVDTEYFDGSSSFISTLYYYDTGTEALKKCFSLQNEVISSYTVLNEDVYYSSVSYQPARHYQDIKKYEGSTGSITDFSDHAGSITWDGQYFYIQQYEYTDNDDFSLDKMCVTAADGSDIFEIDSQLLMQGQDQIRWFAPHMDKDYLIMDGMMITDKGFRIVWNIFQKQDLLSQNYTCRKIIFDMVSH